MLFSDLIKDTLYPIFLKSTGVSKDTRTIEKDNIYFALKGGNFDGNLFAKAALDAGADYAVIDTKQDDLIGDDRAIMVKDALKTLQKLASYHRIQLKAKIIGLTGSNGKTTTKELLYTIMKAYNSNTYATKGNLNNAIGVPLTLLNIPIDAEYAIVEMGSNQPGDIAELCDITQPDYGLITNIGKTHLEKLITQDGVFKEKSALYRSVTQTAGKFFVNEGDSYLKTLKTSDTTSYSSEKTLKGSLKQTSTSILEFDYTRNGITHHIQTNLFGAYNMENIAAAISIAEYFDVPSKTIEDAIASYIPSNMRSEVRKTDKNSIIVDAYNANPASMNSAVDEFSKVDAAKKIAFIGDMLELGEKSDIEHQTLINKCMNIKNMSVYFIGHELSKHTSHNAFTTVEECIMSTELKKIEESTILLKGSRGVRLEKLLPYL